MHYHSSLFIIIFCYYSSQFIIIPLYSLPLLIDFFYYSSSFITIDYHSLILIDIHYYLLSLNIIYYHSLFGIFYTTNCSYLLQQIGYLSMDSNVLNTFSTFTKRNQCLSHSILNIFVYWAILRTFRTIIITILPVGNILWIQW